MNDNMLAAFADELAAHQYLEGLLWPQGPVCPHCSALDRIGKLDGASTRIGTYKCYACRRIFSITYGTIFEGSHTPLHKWLQAIYLTDAGSKPIRPYHLAKIIDVSFKTATAILHKLRGARVAMRPVPAQRPAANHRDTQTSIDPSFGRCRGMGIVAGSPSWDEVFGVQKFDPGRPRRSWP